MTNPFDFPGLTKGTIGFEDFFDKFGKLYNTTTSLYPPYNIKKTGENTYVIELAVAGFTKQNIELTLENDILTVKGEISSDEENTDNIIFKGIADRAFVRKFTLADTVEVKNADLLNGMLKIWLERIIPEHKKPRNIEINDNEGEETEKKSKKNGSIFHQPV